MKKNKKRSTSVVDLFLFSITDQLSKLLQTQNLIDFERLSFAFGCNGGDGFDFDLIFHTFICNPTDDDLILG
jgi:hypothetical protein